MKTNFTEKVSLIIPCRNEEKYIGLCLNSIIQNDYPKHLIEVIIVDGESNDATRHTIHDYMQKFAYIKLIDNPDKITPKAMNRGIKESNGQYIIILSCHSRYAKDYISTLILWHRRLKCDNVGGVFITKVLNPSKKANAIKKVLSNSMGVGNAHYRTGITEPVIADTAAFGCYKREVFDKIGFYNEKLIRNQDIELNKRLSRMGGITYLVPDVSCIYYARETYYQLACNNFSNGLWIFPLVYFTKRFDSLSLRHYIPFLFVLSLIIPVLFSIFHKALLFISIFSFILYNLLIIFFSIQLKDKSTGFVYLFKAFYTLHFSYGFGTVLGLFKMIRILFNHTKENK